MPPPSEAESKKPLPGLNRSLRGAEQLLWDSCIILGDFKTVMPEALNNVKPISEEKVSNAVKSIIFLKRIPLPGINLHNLQSSKQTHANKTITSKQVIFLKSD